MWLDGTSTKSPVRLPMLAFQLALHLLRWELVPEIDTLVQRCAAIVSCWGHVGLLFLASCQATLQAADGGIGRQNLCQCLCSSWGQGSNHGGLVFSIYTFYTILSLTQLGLRPEASRSSSNNLRPQGCCGTIQATGR